MGYVPVEGNILPDFLKGKLRVVVQGDHDRYASPGQVRTELSKYQIDADVLEIKNVDHSYRNIKTNNLAEYAIQDLAIDELLKRI